MSLFATYRVNTGVFYVGDRVLWLEEDGRKRYGDVVGFDGPNPLVLFDGTSEPTPRATEDLWLTAGNYPDGHEDDE
ncbi:hypothetical protein [Saccharothrix sp. ST-888]|uniref:hypothetical protein n=1 Tax=Saccharothrix sp. ST-888 TaxID=1427391 RepID=UPI0005EC7414|nr:hypothetical protein [Saccharothrix sp. ST-888]KJK56238.1 hypothetical protein UK12_23945 [Saccharothrix sp. ST-888]